MIERTADSRIHGRVLTGILLLASAVTVFPVTDAIAKHLSARYNPVQILWLRYVAQLALILPILASARGRAALLASRRPAMQVGRSLLTVFGTLAFLAAIKFVPLVDAVAILFANAVLMVALSAPLLGEQVGWHRWSAVIVGFCGILLVMRPGLGVVHWAVSLAFVAALCGALYQIATRALTSTDSAQTSFLFVTLTGVVALAPAMPFVWTGMTVGVWLWTLGAAICGAVAQYFMIKSFTYAPASTLAPFNYFEIGSATALGYFWFGDVPDRWTLLGLAIIVGSGLYVLRREQRAEARH